MMQYISSQINSQKVVCIAAGGTGGHIFPALAVAKQLQTHGYQVHWLGTPKGLESEIIPKQHIPLHCISIEGIRGKRWTRWVSAPFQILRALWQSGRILLNLKPVMVLGMGGFVSGPVGIAAWMLRKPLVVHEQNAVAGTTNRLLARFADKVLQAFPNSFAPSVPAILTGNPVREGFIGSQKENGKVQDRKFRLLVLGGSRGAGALNQMLPVALAQLSLEQRPEVWHQAGGTHFESTQAEYQKHCVAAKVSPFIEEMSEAYAWADLVVARAGALTIAEIQAMGVASILIPYPHAIDDHQTKNAAYLSDKGAAILIRQQDLTAEGLAFQLKGLFEAPERLQQMAEKARSKEQQEALARVVEHCVSVVRFVS